jgi:tetratricopeptide (TPR) repeat protein
MTVSPTVSYWDCGEFIACSYGLHVPHPPGAPLFLIVGRLFSMFRFVEDIGLRVNYISVLSSALTVMLLYLSIVHLIREWKGTLSDAADWRLAIFSGVLGSLTFAFTHSFWFNAVEAEVYAPSMLFTALLVFLILVWAEKSEEPGNERYLLMISYLIGLAIGVHLLNVLALPFVIMIYYFKRFEYSLQSFIVMVIISSGMILFIYPGVVKYLPRIADVAGAVGLALVFITLLSIVLWSINNNKKLISLVSLSVLLIVIGYSTYAMIFIRSNLDPMIDENNPETIEKFISYLNREQYGDHSITDREKVWRESPNGKNYKSVSDYFWNYQINKMYIRYFLWQFAGMAENERDVSAKQLYMIPLILGVLGMVWHFRNDRRRALSVLALFFMTGLAIVLYLNQPDPQPRERDYSYVGSFFAFSLWIGLGYAGVMELIRSGAKEAKQNVGVASVVFGILLLASPVLLLSRNYESHSRDGRYIAWDYSYNMLQTCEPNALLITNGDNDTFPLWYLQEVDSVRRDVRVVNLSLLNTDWYIQQLRDLEPKVPIRMNDSEISQLGLIPWNKKKVSLDVPKSFAEQQASEFRDGFRQVNIEVPSRIAFEVEPALQTRYGSVLRVQDYMVLRILNANKWRKPVYFAVTVAKSNMLSELQQYMRMDGLAYKLVPYKNWNISPENLRRNLNSVYKYRGLQDSTVHYDKNIQGLLQNYRTAYLQLIEYYARINQRQEISVLLEQMEERVPSEVIPWTNRYLKLLRDSYELTTGTRSTDSLYTQKYGEQELLMMGENMYRLNMFPQARDIFVNVYEGNPNNIQALSLLISVLERMGDYQNGITYLESWLERNPRDANALQKLSSFKEKL